MAKGLTNPFHDSQITIQETTYRSIEIGSRFFSFSLSR